MKKFIFLLCIVIVACSPTATPASVSPTQNPSASITPTETKLPPTTQQPHRSSINYGPDNFPAHINPLTGREVLEEAPLQFPAVLVSISNSPASARPQAGLGFAPWVFELFIGEGATRFMNVFYGDIPRDVPNIIGDCKVREEIVHPNGNWIGNRVWLDENKNGIQDDWEMGIGGVCIRLLDGTSHEALSETSTDSNGYYSFENPHRAIIVQFVKPSVYQFTQPNIGYEETDSDADMTTGETLVIQTDDTASFWDAGLILAKGTVATPQANATNTPVYIPSETYVGPIRSGRLTYNQIGAMFPNSCLVYASAAWDIGEMLNACEIVFGVDPTTPNSALLPISRLRELAKENLNPKQPVNYSGNWFADEIPKGGQTANQINVFYHAFNQSAWTYDPVSQTYLRFTDNADGKGKLHPATDRLTGRQLTFENVIVVFAEHMRYRHNQFEINFGNGESNFAYLFRDGQAFRIYWTTSNREYEKTTGLRRPMHFVDAQGNLIPLHPGRTWIHIVTPFSSVQDQGNAKWTVTFAQPYDPPDTPTP